MNILHLTGMRSNKYGGLEKELVELAKLCQAYNYKLMLAYESVPSSHTYLTDLKRLNVDVVILPARNNFFSFIYNFLLLVHKFKPNIVHCHFNPAAKYAIPLARVLRIPTLQTFRSMPGVHFLSRLSTKVRCALSTEVLAVSNAVKNSLKMISGSNNISTFYNGVSIIHSNNEPSITRVKLKIDHDEIVIANISFHADIKGVDILLAVLAQLIKLNPKITLIQMGAESSTGGTQKLKILAAELGIEDNIIWLGATDNVHDYLRLADMYCHTSRSEGFGRAIVEAMTHKLPVVATNVGGVSEIISNKEVGLLAPSEDVTEIANNLQKLIENRQLRLKIGIAAYEHVLKNFSIENQAQKLIKKYQLLMK